MGFEVNRFITSNEINQDLICNICKGVLEDAVWAPNCEHAFCKVCINKWLTRRTTCPNDRQHLHQSLLKPIPRFMRNILDKLDIKCDFATNGCEQVLKLESIRQHISICDFNPEKRIECHSGCGLVIKKAELQTHNCVKDLRKTVNNLVEDNLKMDRMLTSVKFDLNSLRNENNRINNCVINLQNEIKQLVERDSSIISDSTSVTCITDTQTTSTASSISLKSMDRNCRLVPNPYVLITPLQSSALRNESVLTPSDEPTSSTLSTSNSRLISEEPAFKRRATTIRVATPIPNLRSIPATMTSSFLRSYSPPSSYSSASTSPRFVPNIAPISTPIESMNREEETTSGVPIADFSQTYNYINLEEQDFEDTEETEAEEDNISVEQIHDYDIEVQTSEELI